MTLRKLTVTGEDAGKRLDQFLTKALPGTALAHVRSLIAQGRVRIRGKQVKPLRVLWRGEEGESTVALVDGAMHATLALLDTGKGPHEVRVSPAGRSASVAAGRTITAVDLDPRKVRANFELGSYSAHDIRVSRDGRRLWAACAGAQAVLELGTQTGAVLAKYDTGQQGSWFVEVAPTSASSTRRTSRGRA